MSSFMAGVLIGGFFGGIVGVIVICCIVMATRADRASEVMPLDTKGLTPAGRDFLAKITGYDKSTSVRH